MEKSFKFDDWAGIMTADPRQVVMLRQACGLGENLSPEAFAEWFNDSHDLLRPCYGCVPDDYVDELMESIISKFDKYLRLVAGMVVHRYGAPCVNVATIVQPNYEGVTQYVMLDSDSNDCLLFGYRNAWDLRLDDLELFLIEVDRDAQEALTNHNKRKGSVASCVVAG